MFNLKKIEKSEIKEYLIPLANKIWNENYNGIISTNQINYMLEKMYNLEIVSKQIDENYYWFWILENNIKIGFLSFYQQNEQTIFLSKLYLDSDFQGRKYGKKSLEFVINFARNNNFKNVQLNVNRFNIKGNRAYKNFGFHIVKEQITDFGDQYIMDDYVYEYIIK